MNIKIHEHKGITFFNYYLEKERFSVLALNDERTIFKGKFKITLTKGGYKFGDEIQFNLVHKKNEVEQVKVEKRNESEYNTLEFYIPVSDLPDLIEVLNNINDKIKKRSAVLI